jgi:hypothetical protein
LDLTEILLDIAKQGPLVGLLLWLYVDGRKRETENMARIDALQKELRDDKEKSFDKLNAVVDRYHALANLTLQNGAIKG